MDENIHKEQLNQHLVTHAFGRLGREGEDHVFYSQVSGKEGRAWASLEGWGLLATASHFCPAAGAAVEVVTLLLSGAGEDHCWGLHSLLQRNLYCTSPWYLWLGLVRFLWFP